MHKKIIALDPHTVNQIAAGEVIESPASIIKELLENAIDAKSTHITIEIKEGGFSLIKMIDNGEGIHKEDLEICLKKHTTSKLKTIDDLWKLSSMGFRGEALSSIAAISDLTLITKSIETSPLEAGFKLCNLPVQSITPCARDFGTTIEVRDVFYNVPARKAFQKSSAQSLSDCIKIVTKIALGFPHLSIKMISQGKEVLSVTSNAKESFMDQLKGMIDQVIERQFLKDAFEVDVELEGVGIKGILGSFEQVRPNRLGQHLYINSRAVFSPLISHIIKDAYGTRIASLAHPAFVLHITLPFDSVDINVHPQKKEVRLKNEKFLMEKIKKGVIERLIKTSPFLHTGDTPKVLDTNWTTFKGRAFHDWKELPIKEEERNVSFDQLELLEEVQLIGHAYHFVLVESKSLELFYLKSDHPVTLINLKALKERLHYENLKKRLESHESQALQALLFPIKIEFSVDQSVIIEKNIQLFEKLGVSLRSFGSKVWLVEALSNDIDEGRVKDWIESILEHLQSAKVEENATEKLLLKLLKKQQFKAERPEGLELSRMLKELFSYKDNFFSPHGEKILSPLSLEQFERLL